MMTDRNTDGFVFALNTGAVSVEPVAQCSKTHTYDNELHDVRSVIGDACEVLAVVPEVRFDVVFAGESWPVDVETDLAVVLEQLPAAIRALRTRGTATIDFFEQGLQRQLLLSGGGDTLEVRALSSHPTWDPPACASPIGRRVALQMLIGLADDFFHLLQRACVVLAANKWLGEWRRAVEAA